MSAAEQLATIGPPIVIATHERSGTHLTIDLLRRQFTECASWKRRGERVDRLYLSLELLLDARNGMSETAALDVLRRAKRPLVKTHALPEFRAWRKDHERWISELMRRATVFYVLRDGRDVLGSLHSFMQGFEPSTRCPMSDFMRQTVKGKSRPRIWAEHVLRWLEVPQVRVLKFEDLVKETRVILERIGREADMEPLYQEPLLPKPLRNIWEGRWNRLVQRKPESTAIVAARRWGKSKKWQETFTQEDREFFHREAGEVLIRLGYEKSGAWVGGLSGMAHATEAICEK